MVATAPRPAENAGVGGIGNRFTEAVMEVVEQLGVRLCVNLGAFPAAVPHTRPVSLGATATTNELAERIGFLDGTFDIPAACSSWVSTTRPLTRARPSRTAAAAAGYIIDAT